MPPDESLADVIRKARSFGTPTYMRLADEVVRLRKALRYLMDVREVQCLSPVCKSGDFDEYCAYHRAMAALEEM